MNGNEAYVCSYLCGFVTKDRTGWWTYQSMATQRNNIKEQNPHLDSCRLYKPYLEFESFPRKRFVGFFFLSFLLHLWRHQIGWDFKILSRSWKISNASVEKNIQVPFVCLNCGLGCHLHREMEGKVCCFLLEWNKIQLLCERSQMCLLAIYKIKDSTLVLINIFFSPYTLQRGLWFCNIYLYEWERTQSVCVFFLQVY